MPIESPYLVLGHSPFLPYSYNCYGATFLPLHLHTRSPAAQGGLSKQRATDSSRSYLKTFVPWTLPMCYGAGTNHVLINLPLPTLGLAAHWKP